MKPDRLLRYGVKIHLNMDTLVDNPSMNKSEIVQLATLWFVVLIFLQTSSGNDGPVMMGIGIFALALLWVIPLYLLRKILPKLQAG